MPDPDRYTYAAEQAFNWAKATENMMRTVYEWEQARELSNNGTEPLTDRQRWLLDNLSRQDLEMPVEDAVGRAMMWAKVADVHRPTGGEPPAVR